VFPVKTLQDMRQVLRSKIHRATVTEANPDYVGSITVDEDLLDAVGLWVGEKVLVASVDSGVRLETYIMRGERGSGVICVNGAAAMRIKEGEVVIIIGFEITDKPLQARIALVDGDNRITKLIEG
jgi:aspartate 1-decarboxylase